MMVEIVSTIVHEQILQEVRVMLKEQQEENVEIVLQKHAGVAPNTRNQSSAHATANRPPISETLANFESINGINTIREAISSWVVWNIEHTTLY